MDDKDAIIATQEERIQQLVKQVIDLQKLVEELRDEIARLKKNSSNSSKPPSSDIVKPPKARTKGKRKSGGQPGRRKCSRQLFPPEQVDQTIIHELPVDEVSRRGLTPLEETKITLQQVELPEKLFRIIEHRVRLYRKPNGQIISARIPKAIRKSGFFTPRMHALAGYLKARCHMSYSTIRTFLSDVAGLDVSTGLLCNSCTRKVGPALQEAYVQVATEIRNAAIVGTDETGHNNSGSLAWTWCQRSENVIFFHIDDSRGSKVLFEILGQDFGGIVMADFFSANRKFVREAGVLVQYCWSHLIREIRSLGESVYSSVRRWAKTLEELIRAMFRLWHARAERDPKRWAIGMAKWKQAFLRKVSRPPDYDDAINLKKRFLGRAAHSYFLFLEVNGVEPTNNATEQAIRHVVIDRRVTQGTRSWWGMRFCERAWTVAATCRLHNQSVFQFFCDALLATFGDTQYPTLIPENR